MKKVTLYPAPHMEIRLHLSDEMIADYRDCERHAMETDFEKTKDCNTCSWNDVKIGDVCACELVELKSLIGSSSIKI